MVELGVIEGFYGPVYGWPERAALAGRLAAAGYRFWHYAPKADPGIRRQWRRPWPAGHAADLRDFAAHCRRRGLRFGVGLSPVDLHRGAGPGDWEALAGRLAELDAIGGDDLVLGFDDSRRDRTGLAEEQARIAEWAGGRSRASRVLVCPTYYSDDPLLDRLFGPRPAGYLAELGAALDPRIGVYWAGPEICPREIETGPLARVAETLRRPPTLWDNYPVNDSPRMCRHLHLRAFTGRPAALAGHIAGHAVNPALQPTLSAIPALTLPERYRLGHGFDYVRAFREAAIAVLGEELAGCLEADLEALEDRGRDRLAPAERRRLRRRYAGFDHPAAAEILRWLDGGYRPDEAAPTGA